MLYFIQTTTLCNLNCLYCGNMDSVEFLLNGGEYSLDPPNISYRLEDLKKFISMDPNPIIAFYGGEPLLRVDLVKKIMDFIPAKKYILQTNGLLLKRLEPKYIKRFDTILVSIDGRREVTDYYRGRGVYDLVLENVRYVREVGFSGDLIARMAVSEKTDIYLDVKHLVELDDPKFDHVHWQLDALWDTPPARRYKNFGEWVDKVYNPGISKLVKYWLDGMEKDGVVLGIVPFLGIMKTLLFNRREYLRCGAGIDAFTITTSGRIIACPIAPEFEFNWLGDIYSVDPKELPWRVRVGEPCTSCEIYHICGGRCLFANKTMLWGLDGFKKVCETVKHLVSELIKAKQKIVKLIEDGVVSLEDFDYPKYNNTTEIIP